MTIRKSLYVLAVFSLIAGGGFSLFKLNAQGENEVGDIRDSLSKPLRVATVDAALVESYTRERRYTGVVKESRRSQLSFQRPGEVIELLVDQGDVVTKDQVLARLDCRHTDAKKSQLEAQMVQAQAMLAELIAGPRPETIAAKRAELQAQQVRRESLAKRLSRREKLIDKSAVSREEFETYRFDLDAAAAQVDQLQSQLDELLAGTRSEQINAQQGQITQLEAMVTDIDHELADAVLRSPFAGRITARLIDEGTIVSAGTPVVEILDDTNLEAWVGLPVEAARQFYVGEECAVDVEGRERGARVQSLSAEVDNSSRTRMLRFSLGSAENTGVLPGQIARIDVVEEVAEAGYWVPTTALTRGTRGLWSVFVAEPTGQYYQVGRRDVELLDTVGESSFVRGTLVAGDQIVANGTHRIVVGQHVSPQPLVVAQSQR